jgi:hypothetical protein
MEMKLKTLSDKGYPLQVGRTYNTVPYDYWQENYSESVDILKIGRRGMVTVAVSTGSALVGVAEIKVQAESLMWNEI